MDSTKSLVASLAILLTMSATAAARPYQLGSCSVTQNASGNNNECVPVRGKTATGVAPVAGQTVHDACTAAKGNARTNLLTGIPAGCGAFINCGDRCENIEK